MARSYLMFHIKIDPILKEELVVYAKANDEEISQTINRIFALCSHFIERRNLEAESKVFPEEPLQSEELWICLKTRFKNCLYKLQGDLCLRSKAAVVRRVVRSFLNSLKRYDSDRMWRFVLSTFTRWKKIKEKIRTWKKASHMKGKNRPYITKTLSNRSVILQFDLLPAAPPPD